MSALEQVLKGYGCFKEGDIEGLAALCHEDMVFRINGTHSLSGEYHGFSSWLNDFLAKIPTVIPGFFSAPTVPTVFPMPTPTMPGLAK